MTKAALKARLKKKIDKEEDRSILRSIEILLRSETREEAMKRRMHMMAVLSNEAIANGKETRWREVREELKEMIAKRRSTRASAKRRA